MSRKQFDEQRAIARGHVVNNKGDKKALTEAELKKIQKIHDDLQKKSVFGALPYLRVREGGEVQLNHALDSLAESHARMTNAGDRRVDDVDKAADAIAKIKAKYSDYKHVDTCGCAEAVHPFESPWQRTGGGYERTFRSGLGPVTFRVQKRADLDKVQRHALDMKLGRRPRHEAWVILVRSEGTSGQWSPTAEAYGKTEAMHLADKSIAEAQRMVQRQTPRGPSLGMSQGLVLAVPFADMDVIERRYDAKHNRGSGMAGEEEMFPEWSSPSLSGAAEQPGQHCVVIKDGRVERSPECMPGDIKLANAKDVYRIMRPKLEGLGVEHFYVLGASIQDEMVGEPVLVAIGQTSSVRVNVSQIMVAMLGLHAGSACTLYAIHNHPSNSNDEHSEMDKELTKAIRKAFADVFPDCKFGGHVVCARDGFTVS